VKIFLDTSSLIKLYHNEIDTEYLNHIFEENIIEEIFLSEITIIEFTSAIWKKVRSQDLTLEEANELINSFQEDYTKYTFILLDSKLISMARDLIEKYGLKGLRSLDSIQLASILKIKSGLSVAITSDELLKTLIESEGINAK